MTSGIFKGKIYLLCASQMALLDAKTEIMSLNGIKYAIDVNSENNTQLALYQLSYIQMGYVNPK